MVGGLEGGVCVEVEDGSVSSTLLPIDVRAEKNAFVCNLSVSRGDGSSMEKIFRVRVGKRSPIFIDTGQYHTLV